MLGNSAVVVVVRTRPRAIPLAKITMRKSTHGFPSSFPCMMSMGLRLAALRAAGAPLSNRYKVNFLVQWRCATWQLENESESWFAETFY